VCRRTTRHLRLGGGGGRDVEGAALAGFCWGGVCCLIGGEGEVEVGEKYNVLSVVYRSVLRLVLEILNKVIIILWSSESSCL